MHASSEPPGQLLGAGVGVGAGGAGGAGVGEAPPPHHMALPPLLHVPMHCASLWQPGFMLHRPQLLQLPPQA